jgi:hypothetical protein
MLNLKIKMREREKRTLSVGFFSVLNIRIEDNYETLPLEQPSRLWAVGGFYL